MFDLQLYDVGVGFLLGLVLVNLFPSLSNVGKGIIKGGKWAYNQVATRLRGQ